LRGVQDLHGVEDVVFATLSHALLHLQCPSLSVVHLRLEACDLEVLDPSVMLLLGVHLPSHEACGLEVLVRVIIEHLLKCEAFGLEVQTASNHGRDKG
jgi:hypothetical protein